VAITPTGRRGFFEIFGIPMSDDRELHQRRDEVVVDPIYSRTPCHHIAKSAIARARLIEMGKRHLPIAAITTQYPKTRRDGATARLLASDGPGTEPSEIWFVRAADDPSYRRAGLSG
jgi:hypothetical protein